MAYVHATLAPTHLQTGVHVTCVPKIVEANARRLCVCVYAFLHVYMHACMCVCVCVLRHSSVPTFSGTCSLVCRSRKENMMMMMMMMMSLEKADE